MCSWLLLIAEGNSEWRHDVWYVTWEDISISVLSTCIWVLTRARWIQNNSWNGHDVALTEYFFLRMWLALIIENGPLLPKNQHPWMGLQLPEKRKKETHKINCGCEGGTFTDFSKFSTFTTLHHFSVGKNKKVNFKNTHPPSGDFEAYVPSKQYLDPPWEK